MKGGVTMAVTMKQIASMAGVSTGTVNRALNNKGRINPEVADRIRAIAAELNYQPNSLAKSLSIKRFNLKIAVILHVTHNQFVDSVLSGIRSAADELVSAGIADLFDDNFAKEVKLDDVCRMQQVHDGCFASFDLVPEKAITLTVPTLLRTSKLICAVPGSTKAKAVYDMLNGPIGVECPASSLRLHPDATLYLDADAAALLKA